MPEIVVRHKSGGVEWFPLDVAFQLPSSEPQHIGIGGVSDVVLHGVDDSDGLVAEIEAGSQLECKPVAHIHVEESEAL